ncbi:unnamed protein product [Plutella xylostella]|uniref:(diamondback moth) hypothetical protein n=1 Tax=Plutella xylostella TaxID=51655 RepID=A0A8S4FNE0_PLUXY|nr:unnamed protein product [Plutella xylostella]
MERYDLSRKERKVTSGFTRPHLFASEQFDNMKYFSVLFVLVLVMMSASHADATLERRRSEHRDAAYSVTLDATYGLALPSASACGGGCGGGSNSGDSSSKTSTTQTGELTLGTPTDHQPIAVHCWTWASLKARNWRRSIAPHEIIDFNFCMSSI